MNSLFTFFGKKYTLPKAKPWAMNLKLDLKCAQTSKTLPGFVVLSLRARLSS